MFKSRNIFTFVLLCFAFFSMAVTVLANDESSDADSAQAPLVDNGIPVVSLTIDPDKFQEIIDSEAHEPRAENCSIRIDVPDGYQCEYGTIDMSFIGKDLPLEFFRGRGNATWLDPKKPFKFKLTEKADLLAMGANAHWVLLANAKDGSLLRNRIASYIGNELGLEFTPEFVPVDFVVNGSYMGSYILGEEVRLDTNRVDLDKIKKSNTTEPEITGGYLLALEPSPLEADINIIKTNRRVDFLIDTPDLSEYSDDQSEAQKAQRDYIESYLQQTEDAIYGEGFRNSAGTYYGDLMDIESAAKYWWVQEFLTNNDAYVTTSTYLYKKRNGKLYWGPLWDFDMAMMNFGDQGSLTFTDMPWLDYLRQYDPEYQQVLRETWTGLDSIIEDITRDGGVLDRYKEEIRKSWEMNYELWEDQLYKDGGTLDQMVERLRSALESRRAGINKNIETELTNVLSAVKFMDGDVLLTTEYAYKKEGLTFEQMPADPEKDGYYFLRWVDEDGETLEAYEPLQSDVTVHAEYVSVEEAIKPEALYFALYDEWVDLIYQNFEPYYTITPVEAVDQRIEWSFSDPNLAGVGEGGEIEVYAPGTLTVTGTTVNGKTASFTLHIYENMDLQTATQIIADSEAMTLKKGEYGQVRVSFEPKDCPLDLNVLYEIDNEEIAQVDENGVIHALSPGVCTMTIRDSTSDLSTKCVITVEDSTESMESDDSSEPEDVPDSANTAKEAESEASESSESSDTGKQQSNQTQSSGGGGGTSSNSSGGTSGSSVSSNSSGGSAGSSASSNSSGGNAGSSEQQSGGSVNTGDTNLPYFWLLLMICSAAVIRQIFKNRC